MAEKYFGINPYAYANNLPISLIDINGKDVDPNELTDDKNKRGLVDFLKTKRGQMFVIAYLKKGGHFSITVDGTKHVYTNTGRSGRYANDKLQFVSVENLGAADGTTRFMKTNDNARISDNTNYLGQGIAPYDVRKGTTTQLLLASELSEDGSAYTIGHEAFVHIEPGQAQIQELKQQLNDGTIQPGSQQYNIKLSLADQNGTADHMLLIKDKVSNLIEFVHQLNLIENTTKFTKSYNEDKKTTAEYEKGN